MARKRPKSSQKGSGCSPMRRSDLRLKMPCDNWRLKHSKNWGGCRRRKASQSIRVWSTMQGWTCLLATQADLALREISPNGASRLRKNYFVRLEPRWSVHVAQQENTPAG